MSASSMPTVAPSAASASARLTAVVDLPTPPLPEATAMMFLMPGNQLHAALHGVRHDLRGNAARVALAAPAALSACDDLAADRLELALAGIAELDVERDVVAGDLDVASPRASRRSPCRCSDRRAARSASWTCGFTEGHACKCKLKSRAFLEQDPCPAAGSSSPPRCPTPTARSTSATSWSTSRPTSGCASSACRGTRCISSAPTTRTARRSCSRPRPRG